MKNIKLFLLYTFELLSIIFLLISGIILIIFPSIISIEYIKIILSILIFFILNTFYLIL